MLNAVKINSRFHSKISCYLVKVQLFDILSSSYLNQNKTIEPNHGDRGEQFNFGFGVGPPAGGLNWIKLLSPISEVKF